VHLTYISLAQVANLKPNYTTKKAGLPSAVNRYIQAIRQTLLPSNKPQQAYLPASISITLKKEAAMTDTADHSVLPKSSLLRWEIALALLIKVILLTGLWFLIFRWQERPTVKPDIAAHFALPAAPVQINPDFLSQPTQESRHVR
jgi:hypothetical protein